MGTRLLALVAGAALLLLAARRARPTPRSPCAPVRHRAAVAVVRAVAPRAAAVVILARPREAATARRRLALLGDAFALPRILEAASPGDPVASLPGLRLAALLGGLTMACAAAALLGAPAMPIGVALVAAAAMAPDLALHARAREAEAAVTAALPEVLDLLASAARAGHPLERSFAVAADHAPPPLAALLRRAVSRQVAGQGPAAALLVEAERAGVDRLTSVAHLIERNQHLGLALEVPLRGLADAALEEAHTARMAAAARAVPLAGVVTAVVIAPACVAGLAAAVLGGVLAGGLP